VVELVKDSPIYGIQIIYMYIYIHGSVKLKLGLWIKYNSGGSEVREGSDLYRHVVELQVADLVGNLELKSIERSRLHLALVPRCYNLKNNDKLQKVQCDLL